VAVVHRKAASVGLAVSANVSHLDQALPDPVPRRHLRRAAARWSGRTGRSWTRAPASTTSRRERRLRWVARIGQPRQGARSRLAPRFRKRDRHTMRSLVQRARGRCPGRPRCERKSICSGTSVT